ncbi:MAG: hypothetical protein JSV44_02250 [Candidatus Zixiibacteriota bacterium]|nr:MAG: hypothetical protein JSV44_02250 [candidate division Zixibacteria bacterium]
MSYKIRREEVARQIHRALREVYPDCKIGGSDVVRLVAETTPDGGKITFLAAQLAAELNLDPKALIADIFRELGVEYEKNLHDKFLFEMKCDNEKIHFESIDRAGK